MEQQQQQQQQQQQEEEEGWPLGLRPLNARVGGLGLLLRRNRDLNASSSITTLLSASPSSSLASSSSSDLDTESTGSFFHDKSITLGSLIGVSSMLSISRRSTRGRASLTTITDNNNHKTKSWLFSLCSRLTTDAINTKNYKDNDSIATPSLGHFLQAERRASASASAQRSPPLYGPNDYSPVVSGSGLHDSLFVGGANVTTSDDDHVPHSSDPLNEGNTTSSGYAAASPLLLSCLCGHLLE